MTEKNSNNNSGIGGVSFEQAFESMGQFLADRDGEGQAELGWQRLREAIDAESRSQTPPVEEPVSRRVHRIRRAVARGFRRAAAEAGAILIGRVVPSLSVAAAAVGVALAWGRPAPLLIWIILVFGAAACGALFYDLRKYVRSARSEAVRAAARKRIAERKGQRHLQIQCLKVEGLQAELDRQAGITSTGELEGRRCTGGDVDKRPPEVVVDFTGADLRLVDLLDLNLIGARLSSTKLDGSVLRGANLYGVDLTDAELFGADLSQTELTSANLTRADLTGGRLNGAVLTGAVLAGAVLTGADLSTTVLARSDLCDAVLCGALLSGADLTGAVLSGADLTGAVLSLAHIEGANLTGATLARADLRRAYLRRADLSHADLRAANLRNAVLAHAVVVGADLTDAKISDLANLHQVIWSEATNWGAYRADVVRLSVPLGAGKYQLNPPEDTPQSLCMEPYVTV